jgi:DTW domain-containing protein YfiP
MKHCLHVPSSSWHRLKNQQQANLFNGYHLLYPCDNTNNQTNDLTPNTLTSTLDQTAESTKHSIKGLLLLDATWQESQKMMRQSPWLMQLPKFSLATIESQYRLRRNQSESGLCTLESLAHALQAMGHRQNSQDLLQFFHIFQSAYLEARQSGQLNPRTS